MGLMKDKFIELCEREGLEADYDNRTGLITYRIKDKVSKYYITKSTHNLDVYLSEPKAMKVILEFAGFVATLIGDSNDRITKS